MRYVPIAVVILLWFFSFFRSGPSSGPVNSVIPTPSPSENALNSISQPISDPLSRITKKPFGIYVSPENSPVFPERFTGYHTGTDFETTPEEQTADVNVYTVCEGPLALKETASGYGGVAVQDCNLDGRPVTVIYGHLRLSSVHTATGTDMSAGQMLGVLGTGYSVETDKERRHLHLGIHLGTEINIKGYVQSKDELNQWLDPVKYFNL